MSRLGPSLPRVFLFVTSLLIGAGCGYHSVLQGAPSPRAASDSVSTDSSTTSSGDASTGARTDLSSRATRLAVLAIRNDSPEPWLDRILGDALRRELGLRADFDLVNDPNQAEWVLRGRIRPLATNSNSFSSFVAALEYSVTMALDLEVLRAGGLVVRIDPGTLSESEIYLASADLEITRTNRLEALRHLSDVLASRVADSLALMETPIPAAAPEAIPFSPAQASPATEGDG